MDSINEEEVLLDLPPLEDCSVSGAGEDMELVEEVDSEEALNSFLLHRLHGDKSLQVMRRRDY
jgi:hypothetical protein